MNKSTCVLFLTFIFITVVTAFYITLYSSLMDQQQLITKVVTCDTLKMDAINIDNLSTPVRSIYDSHLWKEVMNNSIVWNGTTDIPAYITKYPLAVNMLELLQTYKDHNRSVPYEGINPYRYNFIRKPKIAPCRGILDDENECRKVYLLFLIKSHFNHSDRRQAVRKTWTNVNSVTHRCVRRVFLIGGIPSMDNKKYKLSIANESALFEDLLQMDFIENYYNNTWKTRGGLKWAAEFCRSARYVMFVDDDYYVATDLLIQQLEVSHLPDKLYMGWSYLRPKPFRHKSSRWFINFREFPYEFYPNFHAAGAIVMSMDLVQDIVIASQFTKHFVFDDVFIGLVVGKLNVTLVTNKLLCNNYVAYTETKFWTTVASHDYWHPKSLHEAWRCHLHYKYFNLVQKSFIQG